jgi:hypothetical protein
MNPLVLLMLLITSSLDPLAVGMLNGTELNQIKQKNKKGQPPDYSCPYQLEFRPATASTRKRTDILKDRCVFA